MKKAISLLVAMVVAASLGVATFAADDIPGTATRNAADQTDNTTNGAVPGTFSDDNIYIVDEATPRIAPRIAGDIAVTNGTVTVGKYELYLVDAAGKPVGIYNGLDPDTEYKFRIYYNNTAQEINNTVTDEDDKTVITPQLNGGTPLTGADLYGGTIRLRTLKGSTNIQSARIRSTGRGATATYELVVTTRATFGTKINEVQYNLGVTGNSDGTFIDSVHTFEVGYQQINDDDLSIGEGGYITISNDFPVITKDQFTTLARNVNYRTVNFEAEDGGWHFTGRVSGMGDTNFYYTYDVIGDLINRFPDQEYKFLNFRAGVTFPASGEMRIDVSDIYDDFGTMYAYLYRNGRLTKIDTTYDNGTNELVFRTNYLGSFVITDREITDTSIVGTEPGTTEPEETEPEETERPNNVNNPATGADAAMNLVVALGLVSLVTAGAVSRKRK